VSDAPEPEEILDAEIVPADAPTPPEQLPVIPADTGYTSDGVPTFESVRKKIETRYGTAIGSSELASETAEGRQVEEQYEARQRAAHDRLEEIRASMRDEPDPEPGQA
jgi:phage shock protein A